MAIYLDYNATTPLDGEVAAIMQPLLTGIYGNPSSIHQFGFEARKVVEQAREQVAGLLNCRPDEIVFTSGGTEANNHAIKGVARAHKDRGRHIITSTIEHPATLEACRYLESEGYRVSYIPVDEKGRIRMDELSAALRKDTILITVMHANNEVGTIQPIAEIGRLAKKSKIPFHTDAAQSAGKISVNVDALGVDLLSLAGHKLYGPKGIGALYIRDGLAIEKLIHGADHEMNRRAGTENVLLVGGLGKACEVAARDLEKNRVIMQDTRNILYEEISNGVRGLTWNGDPENCLPNTLSISFPGIDSNLMLAGMPGIAASAGAACHAEHTSISHVLQAMGIEESLALGTIRLSTGKGTGMEEIHEAAGIIIETANSLQGHETAEPGQTGGPIRLTGFTSGLGCACKMRPQDLETVLRKLPLPENENILVGSDSSDDASVWRAGPDLAWVQSVDFFTPVVDDPFTFGKIAAANALSDLYAMGAIPLFALNIVAFPSHRLPLDILHRILEGAYEMAREAGISIVGGHSIEDPELKYGMVVSGRVHPGRILRNTGAIPGDALILTKPLGTGILATALKRDRLRKDYRNALIQTMKQLNRPPEGVFEKFDIHAVTDVTGFGLLGHLYEMVKGSEVSARVNYESVPQLKGLQESIIEGMVPGGSMQNLEFIDQYTFWESGLSKERRIVLADAQTNGGLLIAVPSTEAEKLNEALKEAGFTYSSVIGEIGKASGTLMTIA